jgi:hypothetical protein
MYCIEITQSKSDADSIRAGSVCTRVTHKVIHRICGNLFNLGGIDCGHFFLLSIPIGLEVGLHQSSSGRYG